ncbi:MAG TPA: hypothetical protein ENN66_12085 [Proteobacteria bacterium]|nr:hypothetical protein [Pseudomonadota bacterium]
MDYSLESFSLLEKKTLALARGYQALVEERDRLRQELEKQARSLVEMEARISRQVGLFSEVDERMGELLRQIDNCLPQNDEAMGSEQILPGLNGG